MTAREKVEELEAKGYYEEELSEEEAEELNYHLGRAYMDYSDLSLEGVLS